MAFNLLDTVNGLFNNDLVSKAAPLLGESEDGIRKAVSGLVPSILTGLLNSTGSGAGTSENIFNLAKQASNSSILNNLGGLLSGGGVSGLISSMAGSIFGDKLNSVTNLIANFAGIKSSSASSLMNMAAPAALGVIGKHATANNLNAGGLVSMLTSQKDNILKALPSGLGLASALGVGSLENIGNKLSVAGSRVGAETKRGMRWLLPVVLIVVAILLLLYFMKGCGGSGTAANKDTTAAVVAPAATDTVVASMPSFKVKLPDGTELDAYKGGIEDKLVAFLNDAGSKAGKDAWFDFDNLNFETGSAKITAESQKQVNNIAAILKAFPKVKLKIGGYTDKSGDAASNKKLSQQRADAVLTALKDSGANSTQLDGAEGYGSEFAKAAATASEEDRKNDRRIAVSVRAK